MSATLPTEAINIDAIHREIDEINVQVLALLERGRALGEDVAAALTPEARAAGLLVCNQPALPTIGHPDGGVIEPGRPAGYGPIADEQKAALDARLLLVAKMVRLLDQPLATGVLSFAQQIRAGGRRWKVG